MSLVISASHLYKQCVEAAKASQISEENRIVSLMVQIPVLAQEPVYACCSELNWKAEDALYG